MGGDQKDFLLPAVDDTASDASLVEWLVELGDRVLIDRPVCLVDVGGAGGTGRVLELTSPFAGTVVALGASAGDAVLIGGLLMTVDIDAAASDVVTAQPSPLVRRLADEFGVDLSSISGTGPGGRVTREDVQRVAFGEPVTGDPPAATASPEPETVEHALEPEPDPHPEPAASVGPASPAAPTFVCSVRAEAEQLLRAHERFSAGSSGPLARDALYMRIVAKAVTDVGRLVDDDQPPLVGFGRVDGDDIATAWIDAASDIPLVALDAAMSEAIADVASTQQRGAVLLIDAGLLGIAELTPALADSSAATIAFGEPQEHVRLVDGAARTVATITVTATFDAEAVRTPVGALLIRRVRLYLEDPILAFAS